MVSAASHEPMGPAAATAAALVPDVAICSLKSRSSSAEAAVTERTRAILPVHIFGYPADMVAFEGIAARHALGVVEDACEALGAVHGDGTPVPGVGTRLCRSLALPFFPGLSQGEVERVAGALSTALGR